MSKRLVKASIKPCRFQPENLTICGKTKKEDVTRVSKWTENSLYNSILDIKPSWCHLCCPRQRLKRTDECTNTLEDGCVFHSISGVDITSYSPRDQDPVQVFVDFDVLEPLLYFKVGCGRCCCKEQQIVFKKFG